MIPSAFKDALIDISADDDLSAEVDLGANFEFLTVLVPTITSSTVTVHVSDKSGGTFYPIYKHKQEAVADTAQVTTAETTSKSITFRIGGVQFIKIACGTGQGTDRTFLVRGFNR